MTTSFAVAEPFFIFGPGSKPEAQACLKNVPGAAIRSLGCLVRTRPGPLADSGLPGGCRRQCRRGSRAAKGGHGVGFVSSSGEKRLSMGSPNSAAILNARGRLGS